MCDGRGAILFDGAVQSPDSPSCQRRAPLTYPQDSIIYRSDTAYKLPGPTEPASCKDGPVFTGDAHGTERTYVGIDVAKAGMDIAVCPTDERWAISNDEAGIRRLVSRLKTLEPDLVCWRRPEAWNCPCGSSGGRGDAGCRRQSTTGARLARATGKLAKTDTLDAAVLAHFGEAVRPPVRPLRDSESSCSAHWSLADTSW